MGEARSPADEAVTAVVAMAMAVRAKAVRVVAEVEELVSPLELVVLKELVVSMDLV